MAEIFVPAVVSRVETIEPGEIRLVTLSLAEEYELEGRRLPVQDAMRPGNAFLAKPRGARTAKVRRRMYTRSNCARLSPRRLETIINHTHEPRADTSIWWQTDEVERLWREGGTVDVRMDLSRDGEALVLFENTQEVGARNLRLEPDEQWPRLRLVAVALSTGITPFLAYVRYMAGLDFGRGIQPPGCRFTLVASVRHPGQLMCHEELLGLERRFPDHFRYYPVLTRAWPVDWPYGKGRIVRAGESCDGEARIDLGPLLRIVPELEGADLRMCGNAVCRRELELGLQQHGLRLNSFRAEVW
ncbi:hypothetical protein [Candidatus Nitrospira bockiana]